MSKNVFLHLRKEINWPVAKVELYGGYSEMKKFFLSASSTVATRIVWPSVVMWFVIGCAFYGSVIKNSVFFISFLNFSF
jgi:hypothetical protein